MTIRRRYLLVATLLMQSAGIFALFTATIIEAMLGDGKVEIDFNSKGEIWIELVLMLILSLLSFASSIYMVLESVAPGKGD